MATNLDLEHALRMFNENLEDPVLARDFAYRVLDYGGHHSVYQFMIDYYSPDGVEPYPLFVTHYKNMYDEFQL